MCIAIRIEVCGWRELLSVLGILVWGVRGVGRYRCLVRSGAFGLVRGCFELDGGISAGGGGGWEVVVRVVVVLVGW